MQWYTTETRRPAQTVLTMLLCLLIGAQLLDILHRSLSPDSLNLLVLGMQYFDGFLQGGNRP